MMYLMYRGYRWIFVFAILWWTFEKGLQLYVAPGSASIASIFGLVGGCNLCLFSGI